MTGLRRLFPFTLFGCLWLWLMPAVLNAQIYTDLHDFDCSVEGCGSLYPAILAEGRDGNLYGTAEQGGTSQMGTVFKFTPAGVLTTLHNFSGPDGQNPEGGLVLGTDGNFYGTTRFGGSNNLGTVFKITPSGALTTLHSFIGSDGSEPRGGLVQGKNGVFYGETCGFNPPWTAYSITASGQFKVIVPDSRNVCSLAPLALGNDGNLYGTSTSGGTIQAGSVIRMTPAGAVTVIYDADFAHGTNLVGPVVQGNDGNFYGTASANGPGGFGVVFKLSPTGNITDLHAFGLDLASDGIDPFAGLVQASDRKFYGATTSGLSSGAVPNGNLFSITSAGVYQVLYAFDGVHGYLEQATPMQHTNGKIYGVTQGGGLHNGGVLYSLDNGITGFVKIVSRLGSAGQTAQILGSGFTGTTSVKFGAASATFHVVSDTYLTATVPANATTGFVTVTTPSGTLTSSQKYVVVPTISSFNPTSGPVGTQVTITGTGLLGTTAVKFGGVKATSFTVNSATSVTATVPAGAVTGKIQVTTPGGTGTSSTAFTVTP